VSTPASIWLRGYIAAQQRQPPFRQWSLIKFLYVTYAHTQTHTHTHTYTHTHTHTHANTHTHTHCDVAEHRCQPAGSFLHSLGRNMRHCKQLLLGLPFFSSERLSFPSSPVLLKQSNRTYHLCFGSNPTASHHHLSFKAIQLHPSSPCAFKVIQSHPSINGAFEGIQLHPSIIGAFEGIQLHLSPFEILK